MLCDFGELSPDLVAVFRSLACNGLRHGGFLSRKARLIQHAAFLLTCAALAFVSVARAQAYADSAPRSGLGGYSNYSGYRDYRYQSFPATQSPWKSFDMFARPDGYSQWQCRRTTLRLINMHSGLCHHNNFGKIHPAFGRHMNDYLFPCIAHAAVMAGLPRPASAVVASMSTFRNTYIRGTNRISNHASGRAIDIGKIILLDSQGQRMRLPSGMGDYQGEVLLHSRVYNRNRVARKFYDSLRSCWASSSMCAASIGCPGSARPANHDHADHIHLEYRCGR